MWEILIKVLSAIETSSSDPQSRAAASSARHMLAYRETLEGQLRDALAFLYTDIDSLASEYGRVDAKVFEARLREARRRAKDRVDTFPPVLNPERAQANLAGPGRVI